MDKFLVFDSGYRGGCNDELTDCKSYASWLKYHCPWVFFVHVPNEGKRLGSISGLVESGMIPGFPDYAILTPGNAHSFGLIEAKRRDRTKSAWRKGQRECLNRTVANGGFGAVGYGLECLKDATKVYLCGSVDDYVFSEYVRVMLCDRDFLSS
jgi:hypothetical protein